MLTQNYFELFGLPPRFGIDLGSLEQAFRRLQAELHPDRYASRTDAERRLALQLSTTVNDGYRTLRHPASRAKCLLRLNGLDEAEAAVSPDFLMSQMEWREAIEEASAARDAVALEALARRLRHKTAVQEQNLGSVLDDRRDIAAAAQQLSELHFYEKLRVEIEDALDQLER